MIHDLLIAGYFLLLFHIAIYGVQIYWLVFLCLRYRKRPHVAPPWNGSYPCVTVQLPVYNEKTVVSRLIRAAAALEWPRDKLEIQVLDDSDDATTSSADAEVARQRAAGVNIRHLRRDGRTGYKAGALAFGLQGASGELIAIFDADNTPRPDFLRRIVPYLQDDAVGLVQARWSFLNRGESLLCRAQALFLDAHFYIEQAARSRGGLPMNFNGTAGVWRRKAIDAAGGWQFDTLTEDLDLSYRAQLAGYRFLFVDAIDVPTELPSSIRAFKTQQYRWARGAMETGLKLLPTILRSSMSRPMKLASLFHLTQKSIAPALLLLSILLVPALYIRMEGGALRLLLIDLPIFLAGTGSMSVFYGLAHRRAVADHKSSGGLALPLLTSLGIGLSVNNSLACLAAVLGGPRRFIRTPKSGCVGEDRGSLPREYRVAFDHSVWAETLLAAYATSAIVYAVVAGLPASLPFLLTFAFGYSYYSVMSIKELYA